MPVFRTAAGARVFQRHPGEDSNADDTVSSGAGIGPFQNPGNFYSNPEYRYGREFETSRPTQAVDLRGSIADYDYCLVDVPMQSYPAALGTVDPIAECCTPRSWRTTYIFDTDVSGAAAFELNLEPGVYNVTGAAATLQAARFLNAAPGAYVLTGLAATLSHGFMLNAAPGTYVITGATATLLATRLLNAELGSYGISGAAATLRAARLLRADPGVYVITGASAALLAGRALNLAPGTYVLTGQAATLLASRILSANPGSYVLTGAAAELVFQGAAPGAVVLYIPFRQRALEWLRMNE